MAACLVKTLKRSAAWQKVKNVGTVGVRHDIDPVNGAKQIFPGGVFKSLNLSTTEQYYIEDPHGVDAEKSAARLKARTIKALDRKKKIFTVATVV